MAKKLLAVVLIGVVTLLALGVKTVWAHDTAHIGDYAVGYGWLTEPPIVGQPNAILINIVPHEEGSSPEDVDVSGLVVQVRFGDQTKELGLKPAGEDKPGLYMAELTPTQRGTYILHLSGRIGKTDFDNDLQPDDVESGDLVQFPLASSPQPQGPDLGTWLGIAGIVLGLIGIFVGFVALLRKSV